MLVICNFIVQAAQPAPQLLAHLGIERAERLVEQQHLRLDRQRARQRDALALAAGQAAGITIGQPVELHQLQERVNPVANLLTRRPRLTRLDAQAERDVLEHRHVPEQRVMLEDEADAALARVASVASSPWNRIFAAVGQFEARR